MTGREGCRAREGGRELEIWRDRSSQMDRGEVTRRRSADGRRKWRGGASELTLTEAASLRLLQLPLAQRRHVRPTLLVELDALDVPDPDGEGLCLLAEFLRLLDLRLDWLGSSTPATEEIRHDSTPVGRLGLRLGDPHSWRSVQRLGSRPTSGGS